MLKQALYLSLFCMKSLIRQINNVAAYPIISRAVRDIGWIMQVAADHKLAASYTHIYVNMSLSAANPVPVDKPFHDRDQ